MAKKLLYVLLTILFVPAVLITANNIQNNQVSNNTSYVGAAGVTYAK